MRRNTRIAWFKSIHYHLGSCMNLCPLPYWQKLVPWIPNTCHLRINLCLTFSIVDLSVLYYFVRILSNLVSSLFRRRLPWTLLMARRLVGNLRSYLPQSKTRSTLSDLYCLNDAELVVIISRKVFVLKRFAFRVHCCQISLGCLVL